MGFNLSRRITIYPSPLNRFIRIMPFDDIHNLVHIFSPFKNYLQTVGIAASVETTFKWCENWLI